MFDKPNEELPPGLQVALHYAPSGVRGYFENFFNLDAVFLRIIGTIKEPFLAQLRLAWWRDELGKAAAPESERTPLLRGARALWGAPATPLVELVNGWEHLVDPPIKPNAIEPFCAGREAVASALADRAGHPNAAEAARLAARRWSLADLACLASDSDVQRLALKEAETLPVRRVRLPRALRPLAVLDVLARRSLAAGGTPLMWDRSGIAVAFRAGLIGR